MNFSLLTLHRQLIAIVLGLIVLSFLVVTHFGTIKPAAMIDWQDIVAEGAISLIALMWIFFILISRPAGSVTNLLVIGLAFFHVACLLDLLDELYWYAPDQEWITLYEAWPAPVGMIFMTIGLYSWHQEQITLNAQMGRRERDYREHRLTDHITGLYSAQYMNDQINREYAKASTNQTQFSVLMLDMDGFDHFISLYGDQQGDRLLHEVAELLLMNLRTVDLACRYAGDRFVVLLPNIKPIAARDIANQLQQAVAHLAFKPTDKTQAIYHSISVSAVHSDQVDNQDGCFKLLNRQMACLKQNRQAKHTFANASRCTLLNKEWVG